MPPDKVGLSIFSHFSTCFDACLDRSLQKESQKCIHRIHVFFPFGKKQDVCFRFFVGKDLVSFSEVCCGSSGFTTKQAITAIIEYEHSLLKPSTYLSEVSPLLFKIIMSIFLLILSWSRDCIWNSNYYILVTPTFIFKVFCLLLKRV